jgi:CspA family cold shock protein
MVRSEWDEGGETFGQEDSGAEVTGTLVRWVEEKGFGFIQPSDGSEDCFVHVSGFTEGDGSVQEGDKVVYYKEFNDRRGKYQAVDVRMEPGFTRPESGVTETGYVQRWNSERGFGFIRPKEGGDDLFCHVSALLDGDGSVQEADEVTYSRVFNSRKGNYNAVDVKMAPGYVRTTPPPLPEIDFGDGSDFGAEDGGSGDDFAAPPAEGEPAPEQTA